MIFLGLEYARKLRDDGRKLHKDAPGIRKVRDHKPGHTRQGFDRFKRRLVSGTRKVEHNRKIIVFWPSKTASQSFDLTEGKTCAAWFASRHSNFHRWRFGVAGPPSTDTPVRIYEMVKDCTFQDMFGGFGVGLDSLALTQAQIKQFAKRRVWLKKGGRHLFFCSRPATNFL
jgi:hypothetical protein